ncbi:MAG TPA: tetratricopeptide repeat protein [Candidatus Obscuribacter sp.]|nr:tetratricopeptide repeat protein [Candidatus Obscuribacter sp.]HNG74576.1 tetratricopeptide repeat protein [Candidatus Obscuribacter sp.]
MSYIRPRSNTALVFSSVLALFLQTGHSQAAGIGWRAGLEEGDRRMVAKEYPLAEGCFRQALRDVKRDKTSGADDLALCQEKLAAVLYKQDIVDESVPLYLQCLKTLERAHGKESPLLLPRLLELGYIYEFDGNYKQALGVYERAVAIAENAPAGSGGLELAQCKHRLARALYKSGNFQKAEPLYFSCITLLLGCKTLSTGDLLEACLSDYGDLLEKSYGLGKNLPSEVRSELLRDRLDSLPKKAGVPTSNFATAVSIKLAEKEDAAFAGGAETGAGGDTDGGAPRSVMPPLRGLKTTPDPAALEAINRQRIDFYERMIAIDIKTLGAEHPSVARDLCGLAAIQMSAGNYEAARQLFSRALKIYEGVYGDDALLVQRTRSMLDLLNDERATDDGGAAGLGFTASGNLPSLPLAAQKLDTAIRLNYLALLTYSLGKLPESEKLYSWATTDMYLTTGEKSVLLAGALKDYARLLRSLGKVSGPGLNAEMLEADAGVVLKRALRQRVAAQQARGLAP